ncbi:MAG: hypothetical protein J5374_10725 [Bacteroidales bacterium]|nr:hypothetical protein [Bacteroidales bacterium]
MEMQVPGKGMAYQAPQSEVLVFQVERRFLADSSRDSFSGNYRLQDGGLDRYNNGENLL